MSSVKQQERPWEQRVCPACDDASDPPPPPRPESKEERQHAAFYDSLSKVWLTRRALKEHDRRTHQPSSTHATYSPHPSPHTRQQDIQEELQRFARHGGPDLRDLRAHPLPKDYSAAMVAANAGCGCGTSTDGSPNKKRSSAYDKCFQQHLEDNKIYPEGFDYEEAHIHMQPALNDLQPAIDDLRTRLARPRPSLSISQCPDSNFQDFRRLEPGAFDEGGIMRNVIPVILGNSNILSYQNLHFTRLKTITNNTTVKAKSDLYDGARLTDLDRNVRDDLSAFIVPTRHRPAPVAPNFFLQVKHSSGDARVAKHQACYNGALGARAMHQLQSYGRDEPIHDGKPYTISATYCGDVLELYAASLVRTADGTTAYHASHLGGWYMTGDPATFRAGATALRNAREWCQEQRDALIAAANQRSSNIAVVPGQVTDGVTTSNHDSHPRSPVAGEALRQEEEHEILVGEAGELSLQQPRAMVTGEERPLVESSSAQLADFGNRLDESDRLRGPRRPQKRSISESSKRFTSKRRQL